MTVTYILNWMLLHANLMIYGSMSLMLLWIYVDQLKAKYQRRLLAKKQGQEVSLTQATLDHQHQRLDELQARYDIFKSLVYTAEEQLLTLQQMEGLDQNVTTLIKQVTDQVGGRRD